MWKEDWRNLQILVRAPISIYQKKSLNFYTLASDRQAEKPSFQNKTLVFNFVANVLKFTENKLHLRHEAQYVIAVLEQNRTK